ncbi:MAG: DUF2071 domain-containing protein [Candidatus Brocadiae bacterium]|nr:DUF2071 domain-containing protein [Candidatus Brocadiia bacterium]
MSRGAPEEVLAETTHRPWPLPGGRWVMTQSWLDLVFLHWRIPAVALRSRIPAPLEIDEHDGSAWIGVVPFRMEGIRLRALPPIPGTTAFLELNVRTYVRHEGKPGVWFFSLDAGNAVMAAVARKWFGLPYHAAEMSMRGSGDGGFTFASRRVGAGGPAEFRAAWRPAGEAFQGKSGTLEHFLAERYCLYAPSPRGGLVRGEIHHGAWPLRPAEVDIAVNSMLAALELRVTGPPDAAHATPGVDALVWPPHRIGTP